MLITGFDTETTGLDPADGHKIIEIALVIYDTDTRAVRGRFVRRFNPQRSIQAAAQAVHGIALSELVDKPLFSAEAMNITKLFKASSLIVAHNAAFDIPFIDAELKVAGYKPISTASFCTMVDGRWATPQGKVPTLGELCFACGVDYDPSAAHAANYDVEVMMASFWKAVDWGFFKPPMTLLPAAVAA